MSSAFNAEGQEVKVWPSTMDDVKRTVSWTEDSLTPMLHLAARSEFALHEADGEHHRGWWINKTLELHDLAFDMWYKLEMTPEELDEKETKTREAMAEAQKKSEDALMDIDTSEDATIGFEDMASLFTMDGTEGEQYLGEDAWTKFGGFASTKGNSFNASTKGKRGGFIVEDEGQQCGVLSHLRVLTPSLLLWQRWTELDKFQQLTEHDGAPPVPPADMAARDKMNGARRRPISTTTPRCASRRRLDARRASKNASNAQATLEISSGAGPRPL